MKVVIVYSDFVHVFIENVYHTYINEIYIRIKLLLRL